MKRKTDSQLRSEAYERETMKRKENPTQEESKLALKAQSPMDESRHDTAIAKVSTFKQLAKVSRSSRLMFGGAAQWVRPDQLFNPDYRDGFESAPFYITRAFSYKSKARNNAKALGVEMAFADGKMYNCGFGLNQGDLKRTRILAAFEDESGRRIETAEPIGPFCIVRLSMPDKPNDYYDIVPYDSGNNVQQGDPEIAFPAIVTDDEIPF
jgi:hypothetical protein